MKSTSNFKTVAWENGCVRLIDQRKLPFEEVYVDCSTVEEVCKAIKNMTVRGAPAIGVTAALGAALAAKNALGSHSAEFYEKVKRALDDLAATRPTAVNLFWAIGRMREILESSQGADPRAVADGMLQAALNILEEDVNICRSIGKHGAELLDDGDTVLTHCNAGALATAGYGTALGVIRGAVEQGKKIKVIADETRPLLQGARLTVWELKKDGIPVTLITDNMAGALMNRGLINKIVVGADRIAANGDTANKIGTYSVAVLAARHKIPFYVAAPISTIDTKAKSGKDIPIEERKPEEVRSALGTPLAQDDVAVYNPAFDVTPAELITAIVTEKGVLKPPFERSISEAAE